VQNSSETVDFTFDYLNRRITTWQESNDFGIHGKIYWGSASLPLAFHGAAGQTFFEHLDYLGTERMVTTYTGAVYGSFVSLPFGDGYSVSGTDGDPYHFASLDKDYYGSANSGTDHAQFRQYSNTQGRWMSPDPYYGSYDLTNPQSLNRYSYALNNPLTLIDPKGLYCYYAPDDGQDPNDSSLYDFQSSRDECKGTSGTWFDDPETTLTVNGNTGNSTLLGIYTGSNGSVPYVTTQTQQFRGSFYDCVRSGLDAFSLQSGLQKISGGRLGNGWLAGAFLGNSVESVGDTIQLLSSGQAGAASNTAIAEIVGDTAGDAASAAASKVPNITATIGIQLAATFQTPALSASGAITGQATVNLPLGTIAQAGAGRLSSALGALGGFKLPYDLSVASFSAVTCAIGR